MSILQPSITCNVSGINYKQLCKEYQDIVPVKMLEKTFNVNIQSYKDQHKYSKLFNKNCEENVKNFFKFDQLQAETQNIKDEKEFIKKFKNFFYTYSEKYYTNTKNPDIELFINVVIYLTENMVPWSIFLCATPSGVRILKSVFRSDKVAFITLSLWLTQIWLLNQYDNLFFRKEFFSFLPTVVTLEGINYYFQQAITRGGLIGLKKYLTSYYNMFNKNEETVPEINQELSETNIRRSIKKYEDRKSQRKKKRQSRQKLRD
jgi:hypothetical protein